MTPPTPGTYYGYRDETRGSPVLTPDGHALPLKPSLKLWSHSPTGFQWGYAGSGPAQLALALLLHHTKDTYKALKYHQAFKADVIGRLPHKWEIAPNEIDQWLNEHSQHQEHIG